MHADLSPLPLLDALESWRGSVDDLESGCRTSGSELRALAASLARELTSQGVAPGDRVLVAMANGPGFMATFAAVLRTGASPLLLHAETPAAELGRAAVSYGAAHVVCDGAGAAELAGVATARTLAALPATVICFPAVDRARLPRLGATPLHPTSGTTGQPKIAVRPARAAIEEARHYVQTIGLGSDDAVLAAVPMSHAYGFGLCFVASLIAHADIAVLRGFKPGYVRRMLAERPVLFPAVPSMLGVLLGPAGAQLHPGCRVLSAGAPLPVRTAARFADRFGVAPRPLYGTTETGGISVARPDAMSGVGPPMAGVEVAARPGSRADADADADAHTDAHTDDDDAAAAPLWVSSSSMMAGYLGADGIDDSMLRDGWHDTGDLASLSTAGEIRLRGRRSDVINSSGLKVLPAEVEEIIAGLRGVREVAVYRGQHRSGTDIVKAAVVADGATVESIRAHCELQLAAHKRPHVIALLRELPRNASGKIARDRLP